jgi:diguanylate cyclase (GGDEF)-like protein
MTIGLTMVGLCGAIGIICLLFRREVLRRAIAESRLIEAATELSELATTDGLTGIANRRAFDLALRREWRRSSRTRKPIALLMIDVDFFKMFNDRYGHQDGDWALRGVAACLQNSVKRPCDLAARYGGEEFAALLQETDAEGALVIAERIRDAVARLAIPHDGNPTGRLTISIGVASTCPGTPDAEALLVKAADLALYDAKRAGRDRVGIAGRDVATIAA